MTKFRPLETFWKSYAILPEPIGRLRRLSMSTQVTLTIPDKLYEYAQNWAILTRRDMAETLTDALTLVITPLEVKPPVELPVNELSDHQLLALTKIKMKKMQGQRLTELLAKQSDGTLTHPERYEMLTLAQIYGQLWIRQAEALAESVRRGLRQPLEA